jgi:hypothetical protein
VPAAAIDPGRPIPSPRLLTGFCVHGLVERGEADANLAVANFGSANVSVLLNTSQPALGATPGSCTLLLTFLDARGHQSVIRQRVSVR